jgi:hypothetical protein
MLAHGVKLAQASRVKATTEVCFAIESAPDSIIETAGRTGCGLIVIGTHGRSGVRRAVLGSVAEAVSRRSAVPVLLVPPIRRRHEPDAAAFSRRNRHVTGSKYLVEHDGRRLLVDCGLFQGLKQLRLRKLVGAAGAGELHRRGGADTCAHRPQRVPAAPGRPRLSRPGACDAGHRGAVPVLLPDAARLQEDEARHANRHGFSKHTPALPLYTLGHPHCAPWSACGRMRWARPSSRCRDSRRRCTTPGTSSARPACTCAAAGARCSSRATWGAATTW